MKLGKADIDCYVRSIPEEETEIPKVGVRYERKELIGYGAFGVVVEHLDQASGDPVAIKHIQLKGTNNTDESTAYNQFADECHILSLLDHENVVGFRGFANREGKLAIVMECVGTDDLDTLLGAKGSLPWERVSPIILGIARALEHLSENKVIHRDIKPRNIMLTPEGVPKLIDFGLALHGQDSWTLNDICGTPFYMAPECIGGFNVTDAADVYSLGATMYIAMTSDHPFEGEHTADIWDKHLNTEPPDLGGVPKGAADLYKAMLCKKQGDRPSAREVVRELENLQEGS